jgi:hypothetical protein
MLELGSTNNRGQKISSEDMKTTATPVIFVATLIGSCLLVTTALLPASGATKKKASPKLKEVTKKNPTPTKPSSLKQVNPPLSVSKELTIPLGTTAQIDFGGPDRQWTLRIVSPPTDTSGRWPADREPPVNPGKSWFSILLEIKNLNAKTTDFPILGLAFFAANSDRREGGLGDLYTDSQFDGPPHCLQGGATGPTVASGQTVTCQYFVSSTVTELQSAYGFVEPIASQPPKRFLLR